MWTASRCSASIRPLSGSLHFRRLAGRGAGTDAGGSIGSFRRDVAIDGVTIVTDRSSALRALGELERLRGRPHAWDTESADVDVGRAAGQTPVTSGRVVCATCFCGEDADFGNGPRLFVDNAGPSAGLLHNVFAQYFDDVEQRKVFHNYSFDRHLLKREDIRVKGFHADTLHLARLLDTSLASWEGAVQRKLKLAEVRASLPPPVTSPPRRAVRQVSLGRRTLDTSGLPGESHLHTLANVLVPAAVPPPPPVGYGLKSLAHHFQLCVQQPLAFAKRFGAGATAAELAHDSPEGFEAWVDYATSDAAMTFQLYEVLHSQLTERPWRSNVLDRPMRKLLTEKGVARDMKKGRSSYGSTDKCMWDFYQAYMRDFGESLADLEERGVGVDRGALQEIAEEATSLMEASAREFHECFAAFHYDGEDPLNPDAHRINVGSSSQIQQLLFGGAAKNRLSGETMPESREFLFLDGKTRFNITGLGLEPEKKMRFFTAAGWPSVSGDALKEMTDKRGDAPSKVAEQLAARGVPQEKAEELSESLVRLREAKSTKSLVSGFVRPLLTRSSQPDDTQGRIHPSWAFDTSTGRLACRQPNLQNLPVNGVRKAFRAAHGNKLIVADYSQLELRVLAHVAECPSMIEQLIRGGDFHSETAAQMFPHVQKAVAAGKAVIEKDDLGTPTVKAKFGTERGKAKAVNFGIIYGKTESSLAEDLSITEKEAKQLIDAWYAAKPEVLAWKKSMVSGARAAAVPHVESLLGRWRTLPLLKGSYYHRAKSERAAVNFGIQGSAADIVLSAMLRLSSSKELAHLGFHIVLQVHDEFVLEGPAANAECAKTLVESMMTNPFAELHPDFNLLLPLEVDVGIGDSLQDGKV